MSPLSKTRRSFYFAALVAIFAVLAPLLIGYAQGYRLSDLGDALRLIRTGGIYVALGESGVAVSVDGEVRETTSFISRNALVQNLFAGTYAVEVAKPGFQGWRKELQVYPELVTEWHPALVPDPVALVEVAKTLPVATATATTAPPRANPRFAEVSALFAPAAPRAGTSTDASRLETIAVLAEAGRRDLEKEPTLQVQGGVAAWLDDGLLRYAWVGELDSAPFYLCSPDGCALESSVPLPNAVAWFGFAPGRGDIFVVVTRSGVWLVEADGRGGRNLAQLASGDGYEARVSGLSVYLRRAGKFWEVEL